MINNQVRTNQHRSFVTSIKAALPKKSIRSELQRFGKVITGDERIEKDTDGNRVFTVSEVGKSRAMAKERAMQEKADAKAASKPTEVSAPITRPIHVRLFRGLRISILIPIALLVIRELVPGVAENLPHVYEFLDSVIIPIIEWVYKLGLKAINWLMSQRWFKQFVEAIASLAN